MEQGLSYVIERLEAIDKRFDEKLDKILVQTTKTNGRVTSLEARFEKTENHVEILKENKILPEKKYFQILKILTH